ncbi:MAG TPA: hypothetical protein VEY71_02165, partial [Chitinophagales bacterium]|nr:hypothetical protein [Chitinophagales bacterium]
YFQGNDPSRWAGSVNGFTSVRYHEVYPGIDLHYYVKDGLVKYDFILKANADPTQIKLRYNGVDRLEMKNGHVYVYTSVGHAVETAPVSIQQDGTNVKSKYKLEGNDVSFEFPLGYNKFQQLTIDPTLIFSTYSGSTADNFGFTATYDNGGNMYLGGLVNASSGAYPTTVGAFQTTWGGGSTTSGTLYPTDMAITKFNADGTARIYSTYLGGSDNDTPHSMFVNSLGQLVVYGRTYSSNFPTTPGCYDNSYNLNGDISITVFNADGTGLVGSTFVGGLGEDGTNGTAEPTLGNDLKRNYADDARGEVVCDANNNIYVASCTFSDNFPVSGGAVQTLYGGAQDGVTFKLDASAANLLYSTYLGGSQADACYSLDLKTSDNTVYVSGGTRSANFPIAASGGLNPTYIGGYSDGFVLRLNTAASAVLNATFLGTDLEDQSYFVKLDVNENVYVAGTTYGAYPVTPGVYTDPNSGQYITKFPPALDTIIWSTVVGNGNGEPNLSITAFLVDTCENVYVCGWGGNLFFTPPFQTNDMFGMPVTP